MARVTAEERRVALRKRTERGVNERGQKGLGKKSVLDYSKAGNLKLIKYQIKSGKETNYIDILPFEITQDWYKKLHSVSGSVIGLDVGFTDYKLEIPVHRNVGENNDIFLCLSKAFGQKCPICEEMFAEYAKDEGEQDAKKIQALKPSWRCFYNIYNYDGDGTIPVLWEDVSYYLFEEALQEAMESEEDGIVTFSDPEMGSSIEFKGREKKLGKNPFIEAHSISFKVRESYSEDIATQTFPLDKMLVIPTYEEVAKCHLGMEEEQEIAAQTEEKPEQKSRTRSRFNEDKSEKIKTAEEEKAPWDDCPNGQEFGGDYNATKLCETCDESLFQACAGKKDDLVKAGKEDVKEEEKSASSRSRSRVKADPTTPAAPATPTTGRTRQRGK